MRSLNSAPLNYYHTLQMFSHMMRLFSAVCVVVVILSLAGVSEANYKTAPMNGIMFGKRGPLGMFV